MFYISEIQKAAPAECKNNLQQLVYSTLEKLEIAFERVDTDEAISMEDCILINRKLNMKMVKTLFLCNRQHTALYLFITTAEKPFKSKDFSTALDVSRLSFAPVELLQTRLGVKIGAATIFGILLDTKNEIQVIIDKDVVSEEWYGCSDGTTTGYMKIAIESVIDKFLNFTNHKPKIIQV